MHCQRISKAEVRFCGRKGELGKGGTESSEHVAFLYGNGNHNLAIFFITIREYFRWLREAGNLNNNQRSLT